MLFFEVSLVVSWTRPSRFGCSTWPQLGAFLEPCWVLFGAFLGVHVASQLKMTLKTIFCRFFIAFRFARSSKTPPLPMNLKIFAFLVCSLLRLIPDRFWGVLGCQNRSKIVPKRVFKGVQNHYSFLMPA